MTEYFTTAKPPYKFGDPVYEKRPIRKLSYNGVDFDYWLISINHSREDDKAGLKDFVGLLVAKDGNLYEAGYIIFKPYNKDGVKAEPGWTKKPGLTRFRVTDLRSCGKKKETASLR